MEQGHLPRLEDAAYNGFASVHWNFAIRNRRTGWLGPDFHHSFRETLLHATSRYGATCPAYCLMPDHAHLFLCGWSDHCRQRVLVQFLRKHTRQWLSEGSYEWQKQPYDNVLRERDRRKGAFEKVIRYVIENPVRANLTETWTDWPYTDCLIPGYPELKLREDDYWDRYWRVYHSKC
jgi:REP element-mobilizing transposase RayT